MDTRGSPELFPGPTDGVPIQTDSIPGGAAEVVANIGTTTSCRCQDFCEKFASDESGSGPADSAGALASGL